MDIKRIFLMVLDSAGIGETPDAANYGDAGSNTFRALYKTGKLNVPNMRKLGLFNINSMEYANLAEEKPIGVFGRLQPMSSGKDTTIGHWEIAGVVSHEPLPTYPNGFPAEIIDEFTKRTGRKVICNKPYSGTKVLEDYGNEHIETGALIVYTSADSVFQVAAHENVVPLNDLYKYCEIAREMLQGEHGVGRIIARPFIGENGNFTRTINRHDYSLLPPSKTMCNLISESGKDCIGTGKISDIFAASGITSTQSIVNNADGMKKTTEQLSKDFSGLNFVNLVDFDMVYGHRNNVDGYTNAMNEFDTWLGSFLPSLNENDLLMITADHGCDPTTASTDHSREYVPLLVYGKNIKQGVNLGTRNSFSDISATILDILNIDKQDTMGKSFKNII